MMPLIIRRLWFRIVVVAMNPIVTHRLHAALAVFWLLMVIPSWYLWRTSIFWITLISLYAIFVSHWGAYQAALAQLVAGRAEMETRRVAELVRKQAVEDDRDQAEVLQRIEKAVTHDD
jgi:hypothetical protein